MFAKLCYRGCYAQLWVTKKNDAAVLWFKGAINSIAQRMAKTLLNYGHSESNRVKIELLSARKWQAITFVNQFIFFSVNCQSMF